MFLSFFLFYLGTAICSSLYTLFRCLCTEFLFSLLTSFQFVLSSRDRLDFALLYFVFSFFPFYHPRPYRVELNEKAKECSGEMSVGLGTFFSFSFSFSFSKYFYLILLYSILFA
ncbi:hypothetical protein HOY80DRAFT_218179 [Tuber brumale]|nr:hypothetical protein HOY80DRAFT_218179 [Tuber brumale]